MDESLKSYARAHVLRARPDIDPRTVDAYITSVEFDHLVGTFETKLMAFFDKFLNRLTAAAARSLADATRASPARPMQPSASSSAPRRISFADLSNAAAAGTSGPVTAPAAVQVSPVASAEPPIMMPATAPDATTEPKLAATAPAPAPAAPTSQAAVAAPAWPAIQDALPPPDLPDTGFRLPNARAGNEYVQRLETIGSHEAVVFDKLDIPDALSMVADLQTGTVTGTPLAPGDYTITVTYHYARQSPSRQRRAQVPVSVAPDPRTMWKDLPSDRSAPYWKEDEQCASVRGPELSIVAASKRGRSHAHVGSFRDDDYRIEYVADSGWYAAVVADGAGSARYSRRGAALICDEAKTRILASLTGSTVDQIDKSAQAYARAQGDGLPPDQIEALRQDLHTHLSRIVGNAAYWAVRAIHDEITTRTDLGGTFKDYSSTALIAVCKRYPFGTLCAAYWIGDGAIGVYSKRDGVTLLGDVDSGEFSGQTRFLDNTAVDHEVLRKRTRFAIVEDMTALVLMTDGVSDAKFETEARLARAADWNEFWDELDQAVRLADPVSGQERRLLHWLDFWSQGNHDDRTIAIIY